jgi:phytoene dehydrogenase-like protein
LSRIAPFTRSLFDNGPPTLTGSAASIWPLASRGLALRLLGRVTMLELLRVGPMCLADWLNESFESDLLKVTLAAPALAGTRAGPWSPGTAANLLRLEALAGNTVEGGAPALIDALENAAAQRGVEIRLGSEVSRIRTAAGVVEGVELAGGAQIDAPVVLSSCDPKRTFLHLLGATAISPKLGHQIDKLRSSGTTAKVDLALREPLRFACRPDLEIEHAGLGCSTIDDLERAFDGVKYRQCSGAPLLDVHVPAPNVASILVHFAPHDLEGGWTDSRREKLGDLVISTLARYAPGVETIIEARNVLTPPDIEERYGVTGGHIHHIEHALDQMITRPAPSCARYATPIEGLYLCGSGSHPGGGLTGGPGALCAAAVLRRKATVHA